MNIATVSAYREFKIVWNENPVFILYRHIPKKKSMFTILIFVITFLIAKVFYCEKWLMVFVELNTKWKQRWALWWHGERIQKKQIEWTKTAIWWPFVDTWCWARRITPIVWPVTRHRQSTFLHLFTNSNMPLKLAKRIYVASVHPQNNTDRAFFGWPWPHTQHPTAAPRHRGRIPHAQSHAMQWSLAVIRVHSPSKSFLRIWQISQWNKITCSHLRQFDLTASNRNGRHVRTYTCTGGDGTWQPQIHILRVQTYRQSSMNNLIYLSMEYIGWGRSYFKNKFGLWVLAWACRRLE